MPAYPPFNFSQRPFGERRALSGFTLIELLVVLAIMGLMAVAVLPVTSSVLQSSQLSQGADLVSNALTQARQIAITKSQQVQVRFYQCTPPGSLVSNQFQALQLFAYSTSTTSTTTAGTAVAVSKPLLFPPNIIIDPAPNMSSLSVSGSSTNFQSPKTFSNPPSNLTSVLGSSIKYCSFSFYPDGTTNLDSNTSATASSQFITISNLHDPNYVHDPTSTPINFSTVSIDPANGALHTYRP